MATPNYVELVSKAEEAVAAVKDPELRRIAFQKVLDDLLGTNTISASSSKPAAKKRSSTKKRKRVSSKRGPQTYVRALVDEDFFKKPKTISQVKAELENRGHHIPITSLSGPLQTLCQQQHKVLRRQKVNTSGKKQTYAYSNW